uniref:Uncharacterized protein n=1 Tax=Hyaloperonospora arabidopsidis (strain Emoy2) TaxID=559515 RepID=M4BV14_HYAAE
MTSWRSSNSSRLHTCTPEHPLHSKPSMKLVAGLVMAALAVTAARADQMQNLRSTEKEEAMSKGKLTSTVGAKANEEPEDDEDDLTADISGLVGGKGAGDDMKVNILDLIGSGSNQVDLMDIIDAIKDSSTSGFGDLSWLDEEDDPDEEDLTVGKGGAKSSPIFGKGLRDDMFDLLLFPDTSGSGDHGGGTPDDFKNFAAFNEESAGSKGDISWLFADDLKSEDPHGAKGVATKGNPFEEDEDEGEDEDEDEDEKSTGVKATKASKSTKSGGEEAPLYSLFDDGSNGLLGGTKDVATKGDPLEEDEDDEVDPHGAKGVATKGDPLEEDEDDEVDPHGAKGVATKGDSLEGDEDEEVDPAATKGGDKATKASKATKSGGEEAPLYSLFDDGSNGLLGGTRDVATKGDPLEEDEDDEVDPHGAKGVATKGDSLEGDEDEDEDEDEEVDPAATKGGDKATKASKSTKSGGEEALLLSLFDDGSNSSLGGASDIKTTGPAKSKDLMVLDKSDPIAKEADSPMQGPL